MTSTVETIAAWSGLPVLDRSGARLGICSQTYTDADSGAPEWLLVSAADGSLRVVPVGGARRQGDVVRVGFSGPAILASPVFGPAQVLTPEDEVRLYGHYDLALPSANVLHEAADTAATAAATAAESAWAAVRRRPLPPVGAAALGVLAIVLVLRGRRRRGTAPSSLRRPLSTATSHFPRLAR